MEKLASSGVGSDRRVAVVAEKRRRRAASVGTAVGLALIVWAAARGLGVSVTAPQMGAAPVAPIAAGHVVAAALVASVVGWTALAVLERLVPTRARTIWLVGAAVVLTGSLGAPLTGPGIAASTRGVLTVMHLVVAGSLVSGLVGADAWTRPSAPTDTGATT